MGKQSQIIIFSGGHWTAGFRALPETVRRASSIFQAGYGNVSADRRGVLPDPEPEEDSAAATAVAACFADTRAPSSAAASEARISASLACSADISARSVPVIAAAVSASASPHRCKDAFR
jgi:hypothetical protein